MSGDLDPDVGARRAVLAQASDSRAGRDHRRGLVLIGAGLLTWVLVVSFLAVLAQAGKDVRWWSSVLATPTIAVALALVARGRRMRIADADRVMAQDQRAPVLYLRPFEADGAEVVDRMRSRVRMSPWKQYRPTYEQRLAGALRRVGPFVAVGDPTESLPRLGAARLYAPDESWQQRVDDLIARASVIIVHAGERPGLAWEVRRVIDHGEPRRVVLSLPLEAGRKAASRQERYDSFRRRFANEFPRPLPDAIGHCQFIRFDADWTPRLIGRRAALPCGDDVPARALRELAREFTITWGPRWLRMTVYVASPFVVLLAWSAATTLLGAIT